MQASCNSWPLSSTLLCFITSLSCKTNFWISFLRVELFTHTGHLGNLQPASSTYPPFLSIPHLPDLWSERGLWHPPPGPDVQSRDSPPTTLVLPSCHHGIVSILTNMPWHPWPSSPLCNPISFSYSIIFFSPSPLFSSKVSICLLPPSLSNLLCCLFRGMCHFSPLQLSLCF